MGYEENSMFRFGEPSPREAFADALASMRNPVGKGTNELLLELILEIRGLRSDLKAADWRRGRGVPQLTKGAK